MSAQDVSATYAGLSVLGTVVAGAFGILIKSNRNSIRDRESVISSLNRQLSRQDERIELQDRRINKIEADRDKQYQESQKEIAEQRHQIRTLRQKHEIEVGRTAILMRYVAESGIKIRESDKALLGIKPE